MRLRVLSVILASFLFSCVVNAQHTDCGDALIVSTYKQVLTDHLDWRVASYVSETAYNEIKHAGSANATIYGVPVGADYSDYEKRVSEHVNQYAHSLTHDQAINVMWTGLDANSANAYSECLKAEAFSHTGLHLGVKSATKKDVSLLIVWNPVAGEAKVASPAWQWEGDDRAKLPKTVQPGTHIVILHRPTESITLGGNYSGYSDSLVLDPFPTPEATPTVHTEHTDESYTSPQQSAWGKNFGAPFTLCTPDKPAGWTVKLVDFHLNGDRRCNEWSTCGGGESDTPNHICRTFSLQGYEGGFHGGNAYGTGVLTVVWTHTEPDIHNE